jgi:pimeloyl-ACP methyl ester carboxylesterase
MAPAMPHVEGVEHRYAQVNGFRMHYAEAGSGEPVILQHGWPQHWYAWRAQIPVLAKQYRVIAPDLRGYGWSEAPRSGYEKAQFAADVLALMDELGIERARYAGHDWGAAAGYVLATDHAERFSRIATLSVPPPWRKGPPSPQVMAVFLAYQSVIASPLLGALAVRKGFGNRIMKTSRSVGEWTEQELALYDAPWREPGHDNAGVQTYRTFLTKEMPAQMRGSFADKRLGVPTLVIMGRRELLAKDLQRDVYEKKGDSVRTELVDSNHWAAEEAPEEVTRLLLEFFA